VERIPRTCEACFLSEVVAPRSAAFRRKFLATDRVRAINSPFLDQHLALAIAKQTLR